MSPIAGGPDVAGARANGLRIDWQRGRGNTDRHAEGNLCVRTHRHGENRERYCCRAEKKPEFVHLCHLGLVLYCRLIGGLLPLNPTRNEKFWGSLQGRVLEATWSVVQGSLVSLGIDAGKRIRYTRTKVQFIHRKDTLKPLPRATPPTRILFQED